MWKTEFAFHKQYFIWSSLLEKCKEDSYRPQYATNFFTLSEKKCPTNI